MIVDCAVADAAVGCGRAIAKVGKASNTASATSPIKWRSIIIYSHRHTRQPIDFAHLITRRLPKLLSSLRYGYEMGSHWRGYRSAVRSPRHVDLHYRYQHEPGHAFASARKAHDRAFDPGPQGQRKDRAADRDADRLHDAERAAARPPL